MRKMSAKNTNEAKVGGSMLGKWLSIGNVLASLVLIVAVVALFWGIPPENADKFLLGLIACLALSRVVP